MRISLLSLHFAIVLCWSALSEVGSDQEPVSQQKHVINITIINLIFLLWFTLFCFFIDMDPLVTFLCMEMRVCARLLRGFMKKDIIRNALNNCIGIWDICWLLKLMQILWRQSNQRRRKSECFFAINKKAVIKWIRRLSFHPI